MTRFRLVVPLLTFVLCALPLAAKAEKDPVPVVAGSVTLKAVPWEGAGQYAFEPTAKLKVDTDLAKGVSTVVELDASGQGVAATFALAAAWAALAVRAGWGEGTPLPGDEPKVPSLRLGRTLADTWLKDQGYAADQPYVSVTADLGALGLPVQVRGGASFADTQFTPRSQVVAWTKLGGLSLGAAATFDPRVLDSVGGRFYRLSHYEAAWLAGSGDALRWSLVGLAGTDRPQLAGDWDVPPAPAAMYAVDLGARWTAGDVGLGLGASGLQDAAGRRVQGWALVAWPATSALSVAAQIGADAPADAPWAPVLTWRGEVRCDF